MYKKKYLIFLIFFTTYLKDFSSENNNKANKISNFFYLFKKKIADFYFNLVPFIILKNDTHSIIICSFLFCINKMDDIKIDKKYNKNNLIIKRKSSKNPELDIVQVLFVVNAKSIFNIYPIFFWNNNKILPNLYLCDVSVYSNDKTYSFLLNEHSLLNYTLFFSDRHNVLLLNKSEIKNYKILLNGIIEFYKNFKTNCIATYKKLFYIF